MCCVSDGADIKMGERIRLLRGGRRMILSSVCRVRANKSVWFITQPCIKVNWIGLYNFDWVTSRLD